MNEERILAEDVKMKRVMGMDILNYPRAGQCALQALEITLKEVGVDDELRKKFVDLSANVVMRRIEKAYQEEGNIRIELEMGLVSEEGKIRITVQDEGIPYMVQESLADIDDAMLRNENNALLGEDAVLYRGFHVRTEKMGRSGQRFVMEASFTYVQGVIEPAKRKFDVLDSNFNIHKVTSNLVEINEAIYCIFHEYQYTYAYEDLYKLDVFQQLVESDLFHSYLVVNDHKQVAGHFGLSESSFLPNMPEICTVVIKVEFRKLHFGSKIFAYAVEEAKRMKKPAMWAQPTAFHTGTQNICNKLDFVPTGFLFQYVNKDIKSEYNTESRRLDLCMCVKLFDDMKFAIYCPTEIHTFAKKLFARLESPVEFLEEQSVSGKSELTIDTNLRTLSSKIIINQVGEDFESQIDELLNDSQQNKLEMLELFLSLECGQAARGYEYLRSKEFVFSGIIPGGGDGVYCVLQHLCGGKPAFDKMVTMSPYTELLAEIEEIYNGIS